MFGSSYHSLSCLAFHKSYSACVVRLSLGAEGLGEGLSDALLECSLTPLRCTCDKLLMDWRRRI